MKLWSLRPPVLRWWWLVFVVWTLQLTWALLRWLWGQPAILGVLGVAGGLWWVIAAGGWLWLLMGVGAVCIGMGAVMELRPAWWRRTTRELASWRRRRAYLALWDTAMDGSGLVRSGVVPELLSHRFAGTDQERDADVLTVHMAPGQLVSDWREQQQRLAATWGLQRLRAHPVPGSPHLVALYTRRYRPTAGGPTAARTVQPTVQPAEESTAVDPPGDEQPDDIPADMPPQPRGAFPRTPRGQR